MFDLEFCEFGIVFWVVGFSCWFIVYGYCVFILCLVGCFAFVSLKLLVY